MHIRTPPWSIDRNIVPDAGPGAARTYRCLDATTNCWVEIVGMSSAPPGSVHVLRGCAPNPTGADASPAQSDDMLGGGAGAAALAHLWATPVRALRRTAFSAGAASVRLIADAGIDGVLCPRRLPRA